MLALPQTAGMHPWVCEEAAELCFWVEVAGEERQKTSEKFWVFRKEIYEAPTCQWIRKRFLLLYIRLAKNFRWVFLLSVLFPGLQSQPVPQQPCCCFKILTFIGQWEGLAVLCWTRENNISFHCSNPEDRTEVWERKVTAGGRRAGDASVPDKVHIQLWDAPNSTQTGVPWDWRTLHCSPAPRIPGEQWRPSNTPKRVLSPLQTFQAVPSRELPQAQSVPTNNLTAVIKLQPSCGHQVKPPQVQGRIKNIFSSYFLSFDWDLKLYMNCS